MISCKLISQAKQKRQNNNVRSPLRFSPVTFFQCSLIAPSPFQRGKNNYCEALD